MLSGPRKDVDKRQGAKLRFATIALAAAAAIVFGGAILMLVAQANGVLKLTGSYATVRLAPGSYSNTIECKGSIQPYRVTDVTTKASGTVTSVRVHEGEYVRQGSTLFELQDGQGAPQAVTASVSGTVRNLRVEPGMTSEQLTSASPALQIADMNVLVGVVQVPEYVSVLVEAGQYVSISSSATPDARYEGIITGFSKEASPALSSSGQAQYDATVTFDYLGALRVGDPIVAKMRVEDYGEVYYVPASAVEEADGMAYVYIVRAGNMVERHQVELLGASDAGDKIIKGDVLTSETIIRADLSE